MGVSKIEWELGAMNRNAQGILVRPIMIRHGGMKRRSMMSIHSHNKGFYVHLQEGVGSHKVTHSIPADSLSEALASVRYIMEGSYVRDGNVVGKFAGSMKCLLEDGI
jgi:hypothetical protein